MFFTLILFEFSVALDCNQFQIRRNIELSWRSRIKFIDTKDYRKEDCSIFTYFYVNILLRVSPSLNFEFRPWNSGMRPSPLDSSSLKTPAPMVGFIDSSTNVKLGQFLFFGVKILCGRFSISGG